jgi:SGNH domain (fused to AT3 domains)
LCVVLALGLFLTRLGGARERSSGLARDGLPVECLRLTTTDGGHCSLINRDRHVPAIVLWGDSFADSFSTSLIERARADSVAAYPLVYHSCPSLLGTIRNEEYRLGLPFAQSCIGYTERARALIAKLQPDVVVLANAYDWYASGTNPHNGKPILLSRSSDEKNGADVVVRGVENTVEFLNGLGVHVILVTPHPTSSKFRDMRRRTKILGSRNDSFSLDPSKSQELTARIVSTLEEKHLTFQAISPTEHLCKHGEATFTDCSAVDDNGNYLLFDGSHISLHLARIFADDVFAASKRHIRE